MAGAPQVCRGAVPWLERSLAWMERSWGRAGDSLRGQRSDRHTGDFWIPSWGCKTEGPSLGAQRPAPQSLLGSWHESWQGLPTQGPQEAAPVCALGPGGWSSGGGTA